MTPLLAGDEIQQVSLVGIVAILDKGPPLRTEIAGCNSHITFYKLYNYQPAYDPCD